MSFLPSNDGPGRYPNELGDREARRRKKLEKQEKRVERLNEPLFAWMCKTFRVITVGATLILGGLEVRNSMLTQADNLIERVLFTALGAWTVFGLVWALSAVVQIFTLKKNGEGDERTIRNYWINVIVAVVGMAILFVAFMLC